MPKHYHCPSSDNNSLFLCLVRQPQLLGDRLPHGNLMLSTCSYSWWCRLRGRDRWESIMGPWQLTLTADPSICRDIPDECPAPMCLPGLCSAFPFPSVLVLLCSVVLSGCSQWKVSLEWDTHDPGSELRIVFCQVSCLRGRIINTLSFPLELWTNWGLRQTLRWGD